MDPTIRLRIATRIHFALLRHYGEDVAVRTLLRGEAEAREALWVCQASCVDELVALARQFDAANRPTAIAPHLPAPQDLAWSQDTSGFGVSRPLETLDLPEPRRGRWLRPSSWLRAAG